MLFYDKFIIFASVRKYEVEIYGKLEEMPHLLEGDFFHSLELFQILEKTPGITPFMAVATQENMVVGQMLVILYHRKSLIPPFYIRTRTRMERDFMHPMLNRMLFSHCYSAA